MGEGCEGGAGACSAAGLHDVGNAGASALSFEEVSVDLEIEGKWVRFKMKTEHSEDLANRIFWAADKARRTFTPKQP